MTKDELILQLALGIPGAEYICILDPNTPDDILQFLSKNGSPHGRWWAHNKLFLRKEKATK